MDNYLFCQFCDYKSPKERKDNFDRHVNQVHLKVLKQCDLCGKQMCSTSLSRHKKSACLSKKANHVELKVSNAKCTKEKKCNWCGRKMTAAALYRHKKNSCPLRKANCHETSSEMVDLVASIPNSNTNDSNTNTSTASNEMVHKVKSMDASVKIDVYSNGMMVIGEINLGFSEGLNALLIMMNAKTNNNNDDTNNEI